MARYGAESGEGGLAIAEFARLPNDDRFRDELVRGRLVREPRPGARHGELAVEFAVALREFVRPRGLGWVTVDSGFILSRNPPTVRGPDVAFVSSERIPGAGLPSGFVHGAPDIAIEILSPSNGRAGIRAEVTDYLEAGTRLVWVVEPATRTVMAYQRDGSAHLLREAEELSGGEALPGFRCSVGRLFESG